MSIFLGAPTAIHSSVWLITVSPLSIAVLLKVLAAFAFVSLLFSLSSREHNGSLTPDARLFSAFMDNLPAFAWIKDLEGRYLYVNKLTLARLPPFRGDWLGKTDADLWPGEIGATYRANDLKVIASRETLETIETCLLDGEQHYLLVSKFPILDHSGAVTMVGATAADITAHQRAEDGLREAEKKYRDIFENAVEGIFQSTPDGHFITANPAMARMLGYDSTEELLSCRTDIARQHYVDPALRLEFKQMLEEDGVMRNVEYLAYRKDGRMIWLSENVRSVCDVNGVVLYYEGFTEDITERKRAEDERDQLFNLSLDPLCVAGFDGYFKQVNPAWTQMLGWSEAEMLSRPWLEFVHPEDREATVKAGDALAANQSALGFENRYQHKDGSYRWFSWNAFPRSETQRIYAVARNITERKRAESALQESEERFRQLSEAAFEAILLHDQGTILEVNQSFCQIYGYERAEVIGKSVLDLTLPELREPLLERVRLGGTRPYEGLALRKDGTTFRAELAGKPIHYQGRVVRVAAIRDVTEQRRNERRQAAQYAVTRVLAESATLAEAAPQLLQVICESLRWKIGEFWRVCDHTKILSCVETWQVPALQANSFNEASRQMELAPGVGLPGLVWQSGQPMWIPDVTTDARFVRPAIATKVGLRCAVAFPILLGNHTLGVMLFFSSRTREVDEELLKIMSAIGSQVGQFIERKRGEEALRQSEQDFHDLFEQAHDAILVLSPDEIVLDVNKRACEIYGFSHSEFIGMSLEAISKDVVRGKSKIRETLEKGDYLNFETVQYRKDGSEMFLEINASTILYQGQLVILSINRDVTERKRADEKLQNSEEYFRSLIENASDLITVADGQGIIRYESPSIERMLGYKPEERIGKSVFELLHPDDLSFARRHFAKGIQNPGVVHRMECRFKHKDGSWHLVETTGINLLDDPAVAGIVVNSHDITERKRAEELLQTFPRRLIEAQEEERKRIARELHDEIGQVLTAIALNLKAVRASGLSLTSMPKIEESILVVDDALHHVQNLALELRPSLLDDLGLAAAIQWFVDRYAQRTGIKAEVVTDAQIAEGRLSRELETACFRIVQEALTNVARHAEAKAVSIHCRALGDEICISIRDDGVGFDAGAGNGTNPIRLGLRGMEERALALGGKVEIKSAPARGTEILAHFPSEKKKD